METQHAESVVVAAKRLTREHPPALAGVSGSLNELVKQAEREPVAPALPRD